MMFGVSPASHRPGSSRADASSSMLSTGFSGCFRVTLVSFYIPKAHFFSGRPAYPHVCICTLLVTSRTLRLWRPVRHHTQTPTPLSFIFQYYINSGCYEKGHMKSQVAGQFVHDRRGQAVVRAH